MGSAWSSPTSAGDESTFEAERAQALTDPRWWFEKKIASMFGALKPRTIMVGLDGAGKSSILYKLAIGETVATVPTVGFNVETIFYQGQEVTVWDVAGQDKTRTLWRHYYQNTGGIIFVVDASDGQRLPDAREALHEMLRDPELRGAVLLVLANKQDLPGARTAAQLYDALDLGTVAAPFHVQACNALTGVGLYPALAWYVAAGAEPSTWKANESTTEAVGSATVAELSNPWERKAAACAKG